MVKFRLRITDAELASWAGRYSYPGEGEIEEHVAPIARGRGYLTRDEFLSICRWKTPRSQPRCAENRDELVREVTRILRHPSLLRPGPVPHTRCQGALVSRGSASTDVRFSALEGVHVFHSGHSGSYWSFNAEHRPRSLAVLQRAATLT
jgi:hypothetical protein